MEHVDVDGVGIAYTRAGWGPPLVLLHGAPSDSHIWQWMLPALSRGHTVVVWDAPGFGKSSNITTAAGATVRRRPRGLHCRAPPPAAAPRGPFVRDDGRPVAVPVPPRGPRQSVLVGGYAGWVGSLPPDEVTRGARCSSPWPSWATRSTRRPTRACSLTSSPLSATRDGLHDAGEHPPGNHSSGGPPRGGDHLRPVLATIDVPTLILHGAADLRSPLKTPRRSMPPSHLAARGAPEARPCVCGGGPRGVCRGDPPVRQDRGLNLSR